MLGGILKHIQESSGLFCGTNQVGALNAILLTRQSFRKPGRERLTWLVFREGESRPFLVARHYGDPHYNHLLEQEYHVTAQLYASLADRVVPEPLDLTMLEGYSVSFERWFDGRTLSAELFHQAQLDPEPQAVLWLMRDHLEVARRLLLSVDSIARPACPNDLEAELVGGYQAFRTRTTVLDKNSTLLLDAALGRLLRLSEHVPLKRRLVNLDFVPFNVLRSHSDARIIDWEYHQESTLWFFEPLKFVYWYLVELSRRGLLGLSQDCRTAYAQYLRGEREEVSTVLNRFLGSFDLAVDDPAVLHMLWLSYFLREANLVATVSSVWSGFAQTYLSLLRLVLQQEDGLQSTRLIVSFQTEVAEREQAVQAISAQLAAKEAQLEKITGSFAWRALSRYGRMKYRYLLPVYRLLRLTRPAAKAADAERTSER
jgi:hypothetical protein